MQDLVCLGDGELKTQTFWVMINIFMYFIHGYGILWRLDKAMKVAFMPVMAHLSHCGQKCISVDVVGKVAKSYLCPGPDNADRSDNQAACHHRHHSKYMLNPAAYLRPRLIALLFPRGERAVSATFALQPFTKSPLLQQFYRSQISS